MAITLAIGTTVSIASTYGSVKAMSAVTNANPAVATLEASHGVIVGDVIQLVSGWDLLNGRVVRVSAVSTNDVTLEGVNTADTNLFPVGSGTGSVREITAWTEITQITRDYQVSGGTQNFADTSTLKNRDDTRIPTSRSPYDVALPVYDDPSLGFVSVVETADETATATAGRFVYPNTSRTFFNGFWTIGRVATVQDSTLRNGVTVSFAARPIRYAS
ncbi:MAG: phage tail tube protein [Burkholderiaceae bacterium]